MGNVCFYFFLYNKINSVVTATGGGGVTGSWFGPLVTFLLSSFKMRGAEQLGGNSGVAACHREKKKKCK